MYTRFDNPQQAAIPILIVLGFIAWIGLEGEAETHDIRVEEPAGWLELASSPEGAASVAMLIAVLLAASLVIYRFWLDAR